MDPAYLARLAEAYGAHFEQDPSLPVLAIDAERFDPIARPAELVRLIERLAAFRGPREELGVGA